MLRDVELATTLEADGDPLNPATKANVLTQHAPKSHSFLEDDGNCKGLQKHQSDVNCTGHPDGREVSQFLEKRAPRRRRGGSSSSASSSSSRRKGPVLHSPTEKATGLFAREV